MCLLTSDSGIHDVNCIVTESVIPKYVVTDNEGPVYYWSQVKWPILKNDFDEKLEKEHGWVFVILRSVKTLLWVNTARRVDHCLQTNSTDTTSWLQLHLTHTMTFRQWFTQGVTDTKLQVGAKSNTLTIKPQNTHPKQLRLAPASVEKVNKAHCFHQQRKMWANTRTYLS